MSDVEKLVVTLRQGSRQLSLELSLEPCVVEVHGPFVHGPADFRLWLQSTPDFLAPIPTVALPLARDGIAASTAEVLIDLAARSGGFERAEFGKQSGPPATWLRGLEPPLSPPSPEWWTRFAELLQAPREQFGELLELLARQFDIPFAWELHDLAAAPGCEFVVPPEANAFARLVPQTDRVILAIDLDQPPTRLAPLLLHLCAHLALDHVRPGDPWGHWDTPDSLSPTPHRQWDRDVRAFLDANYPAPARRVASLEECTPREKGWLVLLDHIERMVGQTRTLHPATERYQAAAYQRQAAQRLVAQLEEYGGAMLCDGVGLGKTYVATTVIVHYGNTWRDRLASANRAVYDDPLRVTVLSPNSVVSTWECEALPSLAAHGVPLATIRVLSHAKLSRIVASSDVLAKRSDGLSDLEHLLLSDLVIVDEAHNFRSVGARRSLVLRDLLRLQPRRDMRRKVLLLTATPINNSLEDLRQQAALLFGKPLWFNDELAPDRYRTRALADVEARVAKATKPKAKAKAKPPASDLAALLIHGDADTRFAYAPDFRDDLRFGVQVPLVGDYLKDQDKRLVAQQAAVRAAIQSGQPPAGPPARIAGELLDRVVVQRSRALCKQIEREQGSSTRLLFRPDAAAPEKLVYEDVYDDTRDVLARFLPLFDTEATADPPPLSLKIYMWADVREGIRDASDVSSVVGLQRVLVLKRLESSPVAFLITLLRLLALHAHRLEQLVALCRSAGDDVRERALVEQLASIVGQLSKVELGRIDVLLTGEAKPGKHVLARWSKAHLGAKPAADADDPPPAQFELFARDDDETSECRTQLERLWGLRDELTRDLATLLRSAPGLADIVFGRFAASDWPRRFIQGGQAVDWPSSAAWAMRIVTDGKLRRLVARLLRARADGQKAIVFSQFTDTLAYLDSVLRAAARALDRNEWKTVLRELSADAEQPVSKDDVCRLVERSVLVCGDTEDRDGLIHAFAPFYRLGPTRPAGSDSDPLVALWRCGWQRALTQPIDVVLATDVLAEGVNLQDAALLINFDVHWNPVRMIQRAGRIDRRLNPGIEEAASFPDLEALAHELGVAPPRYWWHAHPHAAPVTVNLLLPDELEAELQLRERIANKTLAIDFTLGLEQGTGAEADWMAEYRYQGISALNAWLGDRAIEQVAGYQQRLRRLMAERGIDPAWAATWSGWLREAGAGDDAPILAWARLGRKGGPLADYTRRLEPRIVDGISHWLWTTAKPDDSVLNVWLGLDAKTFPPPTRTDLPFSEHASRPIAADDLLAAARRIVDRDTVLEELSDIRRPLLQGATAISAGFLGAEPDRRAIAMGGFRLLQLRRADAPPEPSC